MPGVHSELRATSGVEVVRLEGVLSIEAISLTPSMSCCEVEEAVLGGEYMQNAMAVLIMPLTDSVTNIAIDRLAKSAMNNRLNVVIMAPDTSCRLY